MVQSLGLHEAEALMAAGGVDVVDVRDPHEWAEGHVPGARNVPLHDLKSDPRGHLPRDRVLFVCARGMRSQTAALSAEAAGIREVYSLDGGTIAWTHARLPIETPPAPAREAPSKPAEVTESNEGAADFCGLPEPGLDAIVGANLRALRTQRGVSLDALAKLTGISRALLGQIELGRASPSVSVVWQIARAFEVPFSTLLASSDRVATTVLPASKAMRLVSPDGRFSSRALYHPGSHGGVEFYELYLAAHSREDANPHQPGTRENLVVTAGRVEIELDGTRYELRKGDAIVFAADVPHSYVNPGHDEAWMYLVMTYVNRPA